MGEMKRFLKQWETDVPIVHRRLILAPTPRERERWHATWLLPQGRVNADEHLPQCRCRCPAILSVEMGSKSVSPSVW